MKHRSIGAFVLLAAALFAIPEAVQDIRSLKGAILDRARGEILQAFLSFHTGDDSGAAVGRRARPAASYDGEARPGPALAAHARKRTARDSAATAGRVGEFREPQGLAGLLAEGAGGISLPAAFAEAVGEAAREAREARVEARVEIASNARRGGREVENLLVAASSLPEWKAGETAMWRTPNAAPLPRGAAYTVAGPAVAAGGGAAEGLRKAEDVLEFTLLKDADYARLLEARKKVRQLRVVRPGKPVPAAGAPEAPQPSRQVACDSEAPAAGSTRPADAAGDELTH